MLSGSVLSVRMMEEKDLPDVARLSEQLGYPTPAETLQRCFHGIETAPGHVLFVAEIDRVVVGWVFVRRELTMTGPPRADIASLVVDQARRGQGIGRRLVQEAESWAAKNGYGSMWLSSQTRREEAHAFYERLGYAKKKTSYFFEKEITPRKPA